MENQKRYSYDLAEAFDDLDELWDDEEQEEIIDEEDEIFPNPEKHEFVKEVNGKDIYYCNDCEKYVAIINGEKVKKDSIEEIEACINGNCEEIEESKCEEADCKINKVITHPEDDVKELNEAKDEEEPDTSELALSDEDIEKVSEPFEDPDAELEDEEAEEEIVKGLTVAELIEKLSEFDEDKIILVEPIEVGDENINLDFVDLEETDEAILMKLVMAEAGGDFDGEAKHEAEEEVEEEVEEEAESEEEK